MTDGLLLPAYSVEYGGVHAPESPDLTIATSEKDPSGIPFESLSPESLRSMRTSIKWTRYPEDVLPLFVAEMDFTVSPVIQQTIIDRVLASDTGYLDSAGPLADAFADFAQDRWGWQVDPAHVHLCTDVSAGIVETLRLVLPEGGRVAITTPVYPSFFEMLEELPVEIVEIPLVNRGEADPDMRLDIEALAAEFSSAAGIDALLLCSPHNPHGLIHTSKELSHLARLAHAHDVFVISDEIHAPLTHSGQVFVPFAPLAAAVGTRSVTVTSASKGWNLAGTKCAIVVASSERENRILFTLPPEVACRASILGLHANVAAFRHARDWLDATVQRIEQNADILAELLMSRLPNVRFTLPQAGYLAWLDFRGTSIADDPHGIILNEARVALGKGEAFGRGGDGHVRVNLACAPETLRTAINKIAAVVSAHETGAS